MSLKKIFRFQGEVVAKNLTIDGRSSHIYGHPLGYRSNIIVMNEKLAKVFTLVMMGAIINEGGN
jgi:hypothetical protein